MVFVWFCMQLCPTTNSSPTRHWTLCLLLVLVWSVVLIGSGAIRMVTLRVWWLLALTTAMHQVGYMLHSIPTRTPTVLVLREHSICGECKVGSFAALHPEVSFYRQAWVPNIVCISSHAALFWVVQPGGVKIFWGVLGRPLAGIKGAEPPRKFWVHKTCCYALEHVLITITKLLKKRSLVLVCARQGESVTAWWSAQCVLIHALYNIHVHPDLHEFYEGEWLRKLAGPRGWHRAPAVATLSSIFQSQKKFRRKKNSTCAKKCSGRSRTSQTSW